jgi:hypothetical protein
VSQAVLLGVPTHCFFIAISYNGYRSDIICTDCKSDLGGLTMSPQVQEAAGKQSRRRGTTSGRTPTSSWRSQVNNEYIALHCTLLLYTVSGGV